MCSRVKWFWKLQCIRTVETSQISTTPTWLKNLLISLKFSSWGGSARFAWILKQISSKNQKKVRERWDGEAPFMLESWNKSPSKQKQVSKSWDSLVLWISTRLSNSTNLHFGFQVKSSSAVLLYFWDWSMQCFWLLRFKQIRLGFKIFWYRLKKRQSQAK